MDYTLVATLGPSSDAESAWEAMLAAGVTGFRLNTSHLSIPQLHCWLDRLGAFMAARNLKLPLILDLQGSKWRLGDFSPFVLSPGQPVTLVCAVSTDHPQQLPVPHPDFFRAALESTGEITLDDARIDLWIESVSSDSLCARVVKGGEIVPRKGVTFPVSTYRHESLDEKDQMILEQTRHLEGIRYALSYVKDAVEMARYREIFGRSASLIAKLERAPAVAEAKAIADSADELWLCRGDLGAELGARVMAETVYRFTDRVSGLPVPVLLAGQVLQHMSEHLTPTRSEVCYLHDALIKGYRGVVLSDETAIGRYPVESCRVATLFRTR